MENITDFFFKLPTKFRIIQALLKQPLSLCKIFFASFTEWQTDLWPQLKKKWSAGR